MLPFPGLALPDAFERRWPQIDTQLTGGAAQGVSDDFSRNLLRPVARVPYGVARGDPKPRPPMQRDNDARRDFRALNGVGSIDSGNDYSCHQILIAAVDRPSKGIHAQINRDAAPGRLIHGTESRLRSVAQ